MLGGGEAGHSTTRKKSLEKAQELQNKLTLFHSLGWDC